MSPASNILVLTSTFPRWRNDDDPPFVFDLCRRLAADMSVTVLAPAFPKSKRREVLDNVRVVRYRYFFYPLERLSYGRGGGMLQRIRRNPAYGLLVPFFFAGQILAAVRLLRKERFDLIHAHWTVPQGLAAVAARALSGRPVPILLTSHGGDLYGLRGKWMERLRRAVLDRAAAVTVVSRAMHQDLVGTGLSPGRIRVIPMGTDLTGRFRPVPGRRKSGQVLFVGRLVEKKGCRYLLKAWPQVMARHSRARLNIVGDGPEKPALKRLCRRLGVEGSVRFLGPVGHERLADYYRESPVVAFPSVADRGGDREGFGLVLVEALGCECAVVATDQPAMADIVVDGQNAMVVPEKDSKKLADALCRLLDDPLLQRRLGREGRRSVQAKFDWRAVAARYRALIDAQVRPGRGKADG